MPVAFRKSSFVDRELTSWLKNLWSKSNISRNQYEIWNTRTSKSRITRCALTEAMLTLSIFQAASADLRFSRKYFRLHRIHQVNTTHFQFNFRSGNLQTCNFARRASFCSYNIQSAPVGSRVISRYITLVQTDSRNYFILLLHLSPSFFISLMCNFNVILINFYEAFYHTIKTR